MNRILIFILLIYSSASYAQSQIRVEVNLPKIDASPYHKPYVAIWLETQDRQAVATLALWVEQDTWLKDLRQWWRKVGRKADDSLDGVTGATKIPGTHAIIWNGLNNKGEAIENGNYLLNIEASREEGGRSYLRKEISLGASSKITLQAKNELGEIHIITE